MTRYMLITLDERNGEYDYTTNVSQKIETDISIDEAAELYAADWYGGAEADWDYGEGWYTNGDYVYWRVYSAVEITEDEYKVFKKHGI